MMTLLTLLTACGTTDLGECPAYIDCAAATGTPTATLEATYGEEGLCWDGTDDEQTLCRAACSDGLFGLSQLYPDEASCAGGGASNVDDCGTITPTGDGEGQVPDDFSLVDQDGNTVNLHDYCARTVLILWSALWEGGLTDAALSANGLHDDYADEGLVVLGLIFEDTTYDAPSQQDLTDTRDSLGLGFSLLADPDQVGLRFEDDGSIPSTTLIGPGPEVVIRDTRITSQDVVSNLP